MCKLKTHNIHKSSAGIGLSQRKPHHNSECGINTCYLVLSDVLIDVEIPSDFFSTTIVRGYNVSLDIKVPVSNRDLVYDIPALQADGFNYQVNITLVRVSGSVEVLAEFNNLQDGVTRGQVLDLVAQVITCACSSQAIHQTVQYQNTPVKTYSLKTLATISPFYGFSLIYLTPQV